MTQTNNLNAHYWNQRWEQKQTGWDIGAAAPALMQYAAKVLPKDASILLPGCGNAHEAEGLLQLGFTHITLLDIAPTAVALLQQKWARHPYVAIHCEDFFEHQGQYDVVLEQTFFCALPPALRPQYARHTAALLKPEGKLAGVLFNTTFDKEGPPFGGSESEYKDLFQPYFSIQKMELCYNSIAPRQGSELFIELCKK